MKPDFGKRLQKYQKYRDNYKPIKLREIKLIAETVKLMLKLNTRN